MMDIRSRKIDENKELLEKLVYAINKAVTEDFPQYVRENMLETNNRNRLAKGDFINDNFRKYVVDDQTHLIPFIRGGWEGRIVVDHKNKITYNVIKHSTLNIVKKKKRMKPHYLSTLLHEENNDCVSGCRQMSLGDYDSKFKVSVVDSEIFDNDYREIFKGAIGKEDGYKHYVLAYTDQNHEITKIELLLLDKEFEVVDKCDLAKYITPDFVSLTNSQNDIMEEKEDEKEEKAKTAAALLKLKPAHGINPVPGIMEDKG